MINTTVPERGRAEGERVGEEAAEGAGGEVNSVPDHCPTAHISAPNLFNNLN